MILPRFLLAAALFVPGAAFAQPAMPDLKLFAASADVQALITKAKADRKGDAPLTSERLLNLAPYAVNLEYRPLKAPAALHVKEAELMIVLQGTGNLVYGGTLHDPAPIDASNPRAAVNRTAPSLDGGTTVKFTPGAMAFVPQNTPHQVIPDAGSTLVLATFHVPRPVPGLASPATLEPDKTYVSAEEAATQLAAAKAAPPRPIVPELLVNLSPYRVQLELNPLKGSAAVHPVQAEFMYVIDGAGDFEMGGQLVDDPSLSSGTRMGHSIAGGTTYHLTKGEFIIVPENTPHQVTSMAPGGLTLMTIHPPRPVQAE